MIVQILEEKGFKLTKKTTKEFSSKCPFCGGTDRFCVWPESNQYWCRQCGKKGDDIQLLRDMEHLAFAEAKEAVARGDNGGSPQKQPSKRKSTSKKAKPLQKLVASYDYYDLGGIHLSRIDRYNPKDFRQRRPDGKGGWIPSTKDVKKVLFLINEIKDKPGVGFTEGEKDALALKGIGIPATCNPGGAGKIRKLQEKWNILDPLKDKEVAIFEDDDLAGRKHALEVAELLHPLTKNVKIISFASDSGVNDVSDFVQKHGKDESYDLLLDRINKAKPWSSPKLFTTGKELLDQSFERHKPIIANGILPYGGHILIAGETGVGKSLFRIELSLHLIMGWEWLGFSIPRAKRVGIFQYENPESTEQARLKRMCMGLGIDLETLSDSAMVYADRKQRVNLSLKGERVRLLEMVKQSEAEVIIYDCLSNLWAGKENENMQMRETVDVLSDINAAAGTACVLIHHFNKGGPDLRRSIDRIRRASSLVDWAMTAIAFTVYPHENKILRQVEFVKVRDGPKPKPILCERDENFLLRITEEESICTPAKIRELLNTLRGRINRAKPLIDEIREYGGCSDRTARKLIRRAVEMQEISEIDQGNGKAKVYFVAKDPHDEKKQMELNLGK